MNTAGPSLSDSVPARLAPALEACAAGKLPVNVALMRLLGEGTGECEAERALAAALAAAESAGRRPELERLRQLQALWQASPDAWSVVRSVLGEADHAAPAESVEATIARWAAAFDRLAQLSPEAGVALYSLGRPDLLAAATAELVRLIRAWGLIGRDSAVLDLGCGIGRLAAAIAVEAGSVIAIDISPAMVAAARRRCAGLANVQVMTTNGRDLAGFADESFDLVLAADVFPYLVQVDLKVAGAHIAQAARLLRPGGALAIFNFSYRGDLDADRADVVNLAEPAGLTVVRAGTRDLKLWDGAAFLLTRQRARAR